MQSPYGYQRENHKNIPIKSELEIIQLMKGLQREGLNPWQIARTLNLMFIPSKRGAVWFGDVVKNILAREAKDAVKLKRTA